MSRMKEDGFREETKQQSLTISLYPNRPRIDIAFSDLVYSVPNGRRGEKTILQGISGRFRSGHLTAILGPSGAGKSTLLNALAGYKCSSMSGSIEVNDHPRDLNHFRKLSCYIMQEDLVQPHLTVRESMQIAADLKLGTTFSAKQKEVIIEEILSTLRLKKCSSTKTNRLSGGERKRLVIALELVNNPPAIFLDEPTTGLDNIASFQTLSMLKTLATEGRTVVCSIHTPTARLFEMFDLVYVVVKGQCAFQGPPNSLVSFLQSVSMSCPVHYNPADFVIEVSSKDYGDSVERMVKATGNGQFSWKVPGTTEHGTSECYDKIHSQQVNDNCEGEVVPEGRETDLSFPTSGWAQFRILLHRMLLQSFRDSAYLRLRIALHFALGIFMGGIYYNIGNDASRTIFNFGFCFTCIIFFHYIPMMPILLQFPGEVKLVKREYFNRWYGLKPYFLASTVARIPFQVVLGAVYGTLVYFMSNQPMEFVRFTQFLVVCLLIAFVAESLGLSIGSTLNEMNGVFFGPVVTVPLMIIAVYGIGSAADIPIYMKIVMYSSYLRFGLEGIVTSIYGNNRTRMHCPETEIYCHLHEPQMLLREVGMTGADYWMAILGLVGMLVLFRSLSFFLFRRRLCSKGPSIISSIFR